MDSLHNCLTPERGLRGEPLDVLQEECPTGRTPVLDVHPLFLPGTNYNGASSKISSWGQRDRVQEAVKAFTLSFLNSKEKQE